LKHEIPSLLNDPESPATKVHPGHGHDNGDRAAAPPPLKFSPRETSEGLSLEEIERQTILSVLEKHAGNRTATAAELGISIRKLYYRLSQYQNRKSEP
jgi:DNA-binding NtrC family response regulator